MKVYAWGTVSDTYILYIRYTKKKEKIFFYILFIHSFSSILKNE